jgi:hypothetical protein
MSKKSDKGFGVSFSPELQEVIRRIKRKESELEEIIDHEGGEDHVGEDSGCDSGRDTEDAN